MRLGLFGTAILLGTIITLGFLGAYKGSLDLSNKENKITNNSGETKTAYFAGGCFWCMEGIFESQDGVSASISGYIGGPAESANYSDVSSGTTQHREGVRVLYDPGVISYATLVELYWTQIDPVDAEGQFRDRGFQYTTAIYYNDEIEKNIAEASKKTLTDSGKFKKNIATKIIQATEFYDAEEYHQDYYKKSSLRYNLYKKGSGRAGFIDENWKDRIAEITSPVASDIPLDAGEQKRVSFVEGDVGGTRTEGAILESIYGEEALRKRLTSLQYKVTQEGGTEKPFKNEYWDNKEAGIYVDIIDGSPLYSSRDKYVSGTGWPSFTKPISLDFVTQHEDNGLFYSQTEIKSTSSSSHVGHVFSDGPVDKGGLRYCMNSAALRFIPVDKFKK